uniref:Uncharacterized protein n=1 Tax=Paramoeba aestuarina TaxID=180227 RepID=A0A7S4JJV8_9EUKA|mmetsp:Transcript_11062/g.16703  ORF Transcript_11062/g.16703 Transcript_11062/m.16703 type:complete len:606 (+) Transcript_11062:125-1942(+)
MDPGSPCGEGKGKRPPLLFPPNSEKVQLADEVVSPNKLFEKFFICEEIEERQKVVATIIGTFLRISESGRPSDVQILKQYSGLLNRFANETPCLEIRKQFRGLLATLSQKHNIPVTGTKGTSKFLAGVPTLDAEKEKQAIRWDIFRSTGRFCHLDQILIWHPSYLQAWTRTSTALMRMSGPLPVSWRSYIALLAGSRHKCTYIMRMQAEQFLSHGGDEKWLINLENCPRKLRIFAPFAAILAHQPWRMTPSLVAGLVQAGSDSWTIAELVHAELVLATWAALCGVVFGCGCVADDEIDVDLLVGGREWVGGGEEEDFESPLDGVAEGGEEKEMVEALKRGKLEWDEDVSQDSVWQGCDAEGDARGALGRDEGEEEEEEEEEDEEEEEEYGKEEGEDAGEIGRKKAAELAKGITPQNPSQSKNEEPLPDEIARFIGENTIAHNDFEVRSRDYSFLHAADYNWKEHCYTIIQQSCGGSDVARFLDEQLDSIRKLTYRTFSGATDVDTDPFRQAVWHYVQRIQGIFYDDYDYREVNIFLGIPLKGFVKEVSCLPQNITRSSYEKTWSSSGLNLRPDERCHVCLIAMESRKLAMLLFGLRAISEYQMRS